MVMNNKKSVTIYDIAKEAGVSPATVSRVLNNNTKVSEDRKDRVMQVINKYDFKPNAMAKGLSQTKSNIIGIIAADIRNPFYSTLIVECEKAANELGYMVLVCNSFGKKELEDKHLEKLSTQRVDGIVQLGGRVDQMISDEEYVDRINYVANKIPVVITGKLDGADCYVVNIDEGQSMEKLLQYLISLGHRDIALIGGRSGVKSTIDKRSRYKQLLYKYGIAFKEEYIVETEEYDDIGGYKCMQHLFELEQLPSAIIAINDFTAAGAIRAITERGLSIPKDVSIASFDNTFISDVTIPKLTSINYNYQKFGERIIEIVVGAMEGKNMPRLSLIQTELVIKDSCKSI